MYRTAGPAGPGKPRGMTRIIGRREFGNGPETASARAASTELVKTAGLRSTRRKKEVKLSCGLSAFCVYFVYGVQNVNDQ